VGELLDKGLRILLYAGDADYIYNWYGVEAVSLEIPWSEKTAFIKADFVVDDRLYGQVRQAGNFTFLRMWNSGHEVPYYQPKASLEMFQRMIRHREMVDGLDQVSDDTD
jgi:carboxypeptidase C (cathepsin A)